MKTIPTRSYLLFAAIVIVLPMISQPIRAQMHRSILDDVFTLYNLLHRDYSQAEEPEVKQKRIEDDRGTVIAILKNYVDVKKLADETIARDKTPISPKAILGSLGKHVDTLKLTIEKSRNTTSEYKLTKADFQRLKFDPEEINLNKAIAGVENVKIFLLSQQKKIERDINSLRIGAKTISPSLFEDRGDVIDKIAAAEELLKIEKLARDQGVLKQIQSVFGKDTLKNDLLVSIVEEFIKKYDALESDPSSYSSSEIAFSGQKAAFGLPGIASSAPMVVDVINEVLMEEIKAEVANAVFKVIKQGLTETKDEIYLSAGQEYTAAARFDLKLKEDGDEVLVGKELHIYNRNGEPDDNVVTINKGTTFTIKKGYHFKGKVKDAITISTQILGTLFPKTKELVMKVDAKDFSSIVDMLKERIREDLKDLLKNLALLDDNVAWVKTMKKAHPEVAIAFAGVDLMNQLTTVKHPVEIFSLFPASELFNSLENDTPYTKNPRSMARLMEIFAYSFTVESNGAKAWVELDALEPFLDEKDFYRLYFGLLLGLDNKYDAYQIRWYKNANDTKGDRPIELLANEAKTLMDKEIFDKYRATFYKIAQVGNYVNEQVIAMKQMKSKTGTADYLKVISYSESVTNMLDTTLWVISDVMKTVIPEDKDPKNRVDSVITKIHFATTSMREATKIYKSLSEKEYAAAIGNAMNLLQTITCKMAKDSDLCQTCSNTNWTRTANLLVSIAIAKDRDDLEAAFKQFAHNPGSWRVKRESTFNVALSVYGGGFFGRDQLSGDTLIMQVTTIDSSGQTTTTQSVEPISKGNRNSSSAAITLSIGPSCNFGFKMLGLRWSASLYVPIVDIGAVTAFRIKDASTSDLPNFEWKDIFSPGAYAYLGLPNMPISIGFGVQSTPALREIKLIDPTHIRTTFAGSFRYGACVAVDLSLLDFKTKLSKKGK